MALNEVKGVSLVKTCGKNLPSIGNSKCKAPEVRTDLSYLRNDRKACTSEVLGEW